MLKIENIAEFRSHVLHKEEIRESDIGHGARCFCYMISAEGTFDTDWLRECRGIVFAGDFVAGRPLHKFFNVNEKPSTQVANLDWSKVVRVMDKRDGSMIHSVWTMDGPMLKSKKTFDSDVAKAAEYWMHTQPDLNVFKMIMRLQARNCTAIFEWTAPDARIVVHYPEAGLQLLHVRNNITGRYWDSDELHTIADEYGVKMVDEVDEFFWTMGGDGLPETREFDIQKMLKAAETRENIEGWVIQFEDGEMVKLKTKWYMERHRLMTFLRERDIAEAVLNETLDDTKAMLVGEGVNIQEILDIEARVLHEVRQLALAVDLVYNADKHLSRKDFAIKHQGEEFFGLMMSRFIGKEPDFKGYFQKTKLKDMFGLRQLVLMPSIAEGE